MKQQEMEQFMSEHQLGEYAVRLEISGKVGSGFMFATQEDGGVYIFTALHVILGLFRLQEQEEYLVSWNSRQFPCKRGDTSVCLLETGLTREACAGDTSADENAVMEKLWDEFSDDEYQGTGLDIAVLRMPKACFPAGSVFPEPVAWIAEDKLKTGMDFAGNGYPNRKTVMCELLGTYRSRDENSGLLDCKAENISHEPFYEAMKGFSGTGLIADYHGRPVLFGIVIACLTYELHQCFAAVGIRELMEKMKEDGWITPEECAAGIPPDAFSQRKLMELLEQSIGYMRGTVQSGMKREFYRLSQNFSPVVLAEEEPFYDIPECMDERTGCLHYWAGRFWNLFIQDQLSGDGACSSYMSDTGEELGISYICSEGGADADMARVVREIINRKILGNRIRGNTILIWQSRINPAKRELTRKGFKNIVADIAEGRFCGTDRRQNMEGYDLLNGEMSEKDYGMIHVTLLVHRLDDCETMEEVRSRIREVLDGIWR